MATALNLAWAAQLAYETADKAKFRDILNQWNWAFVDFLDGTFDSDLPVSITAGFVARAGDSTVLAFAGTEPDSPQQWLLDLSIATTDGVHAGFREGVEAIWKQLSPHVTGASAIYITGHSLGGALSVVAARRLCGEPLAMGAKIRAVYTMGMPRAFTKQLAQVYNETSLGSRPPLGLRTFRLIHGADIVPDVPLTTPPLNYRHVGAALSCDRGEQFEAHALQPVQMEPAGAAIPSIVTDFIANPASFTSGILAKAKQVIDLLSGDSDTPEFPAENPGVANDAAKLPPFIRDHLMDGYLRALGAEI